MEWSYWFFTVGYGRYFVSLRHSMLSQLSTWVEKSLQLVDEVAFMGHLQPLSMSLKITKNITKFQDVIIIS